jgi:hypothetical protein
MDIEELPPEVAAEGDAYSRLCEAAKAMFAQPLTNQMLTSIIIRRHNKDCSSMTLEYVFNEPLEEKDTDPPDTLPSGTP